MLLSEKTIRKIIKENLLQSLLLEAALKDFKNPELNIGEYSPLQIMQKKFESILKNEIEDIDIEQNDPKYAAKASSLTKSYDVSGWDSNSIARFFSEPLLEVFKEIKKSHEEEKEKTSKVNDILDELSFLYSKKDKGDVIYNQDNAGEDENITAKELILFLKDKNTKNIKLQDMFNGLSIFKKIHKIHEDIKNYFLSDYSDPSKLNKVKKTIIENETEYLFGRDIYEGYKIVVPTTTRSSVFWARTNWKAEKNVLPKQEDISWCTARYTGGNMFRTYFVGGGTNLFYFLPEGDLEGKRKFCIGITKIKKSDGEIKLKCGGHTSVDFSNSPFLPNESDFNDPQVRKEILSRLKIKNPKILDAMAEKMKEKDPFNQFKYISEVGIDQFKALVHIKRNDNGYATNGKEVSGEINKFLGVYIEDEYKEKYTYDQKILKFIERSIFPEDYEGNMQIENSWLGPKNNLKIKSEYIEFFFPEKEKKHFDFYENFKIMEDYTQFKKSHFGLAKDHTKIKEKSILKFLNEKNDFVNRFEYMYSRDRNKSLDILQRDEIKTLLKDEVKDKINFVLGLLRIDRHYYGFEKSIFDFLPIEFCNLKNIFSSIQEGNTDVGLELPLIANFILSDLTKIEENKNIILKKLKEREGWLDLSKYLEGIIEKNEIKDRDILAAVMNLIENSLDVIKNQSDDGHYLINFISSGKIFKSYKIAKIIFSKGIDWFDKSLEKVNYNTREYKKGKIIHEFIIQNETEFAKEKNKEAIEALKVFLLKCKQDNKNIWEIFDMYFLSFLKNRFSSTDTHNDYNTQLYHMILKILAYYFQDITKIPKEIAKNHSDLIKYIIHFHPEQKKNLGFIKRMFHATKDAFSKEKEPTQREKEFFEERRNRKNIVMTETQLRQFIRKNLN
jgi:hypothetical protein